MDRKWWTLIAVCVGTFMLLLDVTIVNVALPAIQHSLKASFSDLQWVVDAYALMLAALLLTTGSLADLWGRRLIFVVGLVVFTVSSLASGLAQSPLWLNLARGAQGVGGSAMFSTSLALLGYTFRGRERGVAFGIWGAITGIAVAIGPVIGGALTTGLSWRWIFLVNVPIGVIGVAISMFRVEESRMEHARKPDPIGVVTFSGALGALVYALIKGDSKGWGNSVIVGCLIGAAVLLCLFLIAESVQKDRAMFDLGLFRKPTFTGGALAAFGLSGGLFALLLYLTLYLQDDLGYSALQTGLRFLVLSGGILLTSTAAGRLTAHVPIRFLIAPGLLLVAVGLLLMRGLSPGTGWTHLIPGFIIAGAGVGLINPPLASTAIGVVTPDRAGMASGINSTFRQIGIATGIAGLGAIFSHSVRTTIVSLLKSTPGLAGAGANRLANSVVQGSGASGGISKLPPQARGAAVHALRAGFASGLNDVFLVGAILSFVCAGLTLILIRSKDFEAGAARGGGGGGGSASGGEMSANGAGATAGGAAAPAGADGSRAAELDGSGERDPRAADLDGSREGRPEAAPARTMPLENRPSSARPPIAGGAPEHGDLPSAPGMSGGPLGSSGLGSAGSRTAGSGGDVRAVADAVRNAEEAALVYAREIAEARRLLTQAIQHLDLAERARAELNRHAGGLMGAGQSAVRSAPEGPPAPMAPPAPPDAFNPGLSAPSLAHQPGGPAGGPGHANGREDIAAPAAPTAAALDQIQTADAPAAGAPAASEPAAAPYASGSSEPAAPPHAALTSDEPIRTPPGIVLADPRPATSAGHRPAPQADPRAATSDQPPETQGDPRAASPADERSAAPAERWPATPEPPAPPPPPPPAWGLGTGGNR